MRTGKYKLISFFVAIFYWLVESWIHHIVFNEMFELIPADSNEIYMRTVIVLLLIGFGFYADYNTRRLLAKEEERLRVFIQTLRATQHILNNFLNQMQLFQLIEPEDLRETPELANRLNAIIKEASEQVMALSQITDPTEENISRTIFPDHKEK